MKYGEYELIVGDGDYRFSSDGNGKYDAQRKGGDWPVGAAWLKEQEHSKSFTCIAMEFHEARDALYLLGKLFTIREIAAACERRGIPVDVREESYSLDMLKIALKRAEAGRG